MVNALTGDTILPPVYRYLNYYSDSSFFYASKELEKGGSWEAYNSQAELIYSVRNGSVISTQRKIKTFVVQNRDSRLNALINTKGEVLLPFASRSIQSAGEFIIENNDNRNTNPDTIFLYKANGEPLVDFPVEKCQVGGEGKLIIARYKGFYGVIDELGKIRLPFEFLDISSRRGLLLVRVQDPDLPKNRYYWYDIYEEQNFTRIGERYETYHVGKTFKTIGVREKGKWGLIDFEGNRLLPSEYAYIEHFDRHGLARICHNFDQKNYKFYRAGVVDTLGRVLLEPIYQTIHRGSHTLTIQTDSTVGMLNMKLDTVLPFDFARANLIKYGTKWILKTGKNHESPNRFGVADFNGRILIPFQFDTIAHLWKSKVMVDDGQRVYAFDLGWKRRVDSNEYASVAGRWPNFKYDGLLEVRREGKFGMVNKLWEEVIPPIYESKVAQWENLIVAVYHSETKSFGVYNNQGDIVVPVEYDACYFKRDRIIQVRKGWTYYYFDFNGNLLRTEELKH